MSSAFKLLLTNVWTLSLKQGVISPQGSDSRGMVLHVWKAWRYSPVADATAGVMASSLASSWAQLPNSYSLASPSHPRCGFEKSLEQHGDVLKLNAVVEVGQMFGQHNPSRRQMGSIGLCRTRWILDCSVDANKKRYSHRPTNFVFSSLPCCVDTNQ